MRNRENSAQRLCQIAISNQKEAHTLSSACSRWGLGAEALAVGLVLRERTGAECCEDTPRGLM